MSSPKTALVYTGLLRSWQQCKGNHYENLWIGNNVDFHFYTDDNPMKYFEPRESQMVYDKINWVGDEHVNWYPDPFKDHRYATRKAPENTVYQTYRQWRANYIGFAMVPQGYDIYCRVRPDIVLNGKLNFADFDCSGNRIYIPQGMDYGGINDQFAFGNYEVMKIYYSVFENVHELWHEGAIFHSETMQLKNLQKHGVEIVRYGAPQVNIVR
jgi:hypothetical protein